MTEGDTTNIMTRLRNAFGTNTLSSHSIFYLRRPVSSFVSLVRVTTYPFIRISVRNTAKMRNLYRRIAEPGLRTIGSQGVHERNRCFATSLVILRTYIRP